MRYKILNKQTSAVIFLLLFVMNLWGCGSSGGSDQSGRDTEIPTSPSAVNITDVTTSSVSISWASSTDNKGVAEYKVYRNGAYLVSSTSTTSTDTGVTPSSRYCYTVSAVDAEGNESDKSPEACADIQSGNTKPEPDTSAPSTPSSLNASPASSSSINISWAASTDDKGVASYKIFRDGQFVSSSTTTSWADNGLNASTRYCYSVTAIDGAGNESTKSTEACASTQALPPDITPPEKPLNLSVRPESSDKISLTWTTPSVGAADVVEYRIYRNNVKVASSSSNSFADTGLTPSTNYCYAVSAVDSAGNESEKCAEICADTKPDTEAPPVPTGLKYSGSVTDKIIIEWSGTTRKIQGKLKQTPGFKIYRNDQFKAFVTTPPYIDTDLMPNTQYCYRVSAVDEYGNESAKSEKICITTSPDTMAPTQPTNLTATPVSQTAINLAWSVSTDNAGAVKYIIYRDGVKIKEVDQTILSDTGLNPSTRYCYKVSAVDAAGNESEKSIDACASTFSGGGANPLPPTPPPGPDTQAPTKPLNLTATTASSKSINLSWSSSTDNIGVTGYKIYRGNISDRAKASRVPDVPVLPLKTVTGTTYTDVNLTPETMYFYFVSALDAAGNESPKSNLARAMTMTEPGQLRKKSDLVPSMIIHSPAMDTEGRVYVATESPQIFEARSAQESDGIPIPKSSVYIFDSGLNTASILYSLESNAATSPVIGPDGTVYIIDDSGRVYALDPNYASGGAAASALKWKFSASGINFSTPSVSKNGTIFFGTNAYSSENEFLYALNPDGKVKWKYNTQGGTGYSSPAIAKDGTIYVGTYSGRLYAFNPDGTVKWNARIGNPESEYSTLYSPAIGADGTIYVGGEYEYDGVIKGKLYAINPANEEVKWEYIIDEGTNSSPVIGSDGTIYMNTIAGILHAVTPAGDKKWVFGNAYDPRNPGGGTSTSISTSPVIGNNGIIYFASDALYAIDPLTGAEIWKYTTNCSPISSPAIGSNGLIYAVDNPTRQLMAITSSSLGLADSPWPKYHRDNQNTDRVPPLTDNEKPTIPTNFTVERTISGAITLTWTNSTDNILVDGYRIYRNDKLIATMGPGEFKENLIITPWSDFCYSVSAVDLSGNESEKASKCFSMASPGTGKLNDTGITSWADNTDYNLLITQSEFPGQDADSGRDKTVPDPSPSDGAAGFSFTKLSNTGQALPVTAATWYAVRDNVTGMIWEIGAPYVFQWYETDDTKNGGFEGNPITDTGVGLTNDYISDKNSSKYCGFTDWRLPTRQELQGIINYHNTAPNAFDALFFPDIITGPLPPSFINSPDIAATFWTSSPDCDDSSKAWAVNFTDGKLVSITKTLKLHVKLVRGTLNEAHLD